MCADCSGDSYSRLVRWHVIPDMETLIDDVSVRIYNAARHSIRLRGVFRIVLAGGSTPQAVYRELADSAPIPPNTVRDWPKPLMCW